MSFKEDLKRRLRHYGLEKAYEASVVCEAAKKISKGEFAPVSFKDRVLKVSAKTAGKAHLIRIKQSQLLVKINNLLGGDVVERIFIVVKDEEPCP